MKRKIPIIKISPSYTDEDLLRVPELKEKLILESIKAVKDAVKTNKKTAALVELDNSGYYIEIDKSQFKSSLENALEYFLKKEEYNNCIECRDLIKILE